MRFSTTLVVLLVLCAASAVGAQLTGKVTDAEGNPLPSASVVTNIRAVGTQTDVNGEFELILPRDTVAGVVSRVTFSSVGYKSRQFKIDDLPEIIVLEDRYYRGTDILVRGDRAQTGVTPVTFTNFSATEIERDYTVGEFPLLLESTPNLFAYSEAGSSLGYNSIRIRGFVDRQVATYINGVPMNDPEDHATYFVNQPDLAANITDIQIQRGVGNSLYGDASFGGAINIVTSCLGQPRKVKFTTGYGEYTSGGKSVSDIYKNSVEYSSGLIDGQWHFGGRFSKQKSGGYRENSWYNGWAYYFTVGRLDPRMTSELHIYGGPTHLHLAYYGVGRETLQDNRRANPGLEGYEPLDYDNAVHYYNQPHYQFLNTFTISDHITLSNTLYYIRGKGYFEQFKPGQDYIEYSIDTSLSGGHEDGDLVRRKWANKNQYGWNTRLDIEHERGLHSLGGSFFLFDSDHFGEVTWVEHIDGSLNPLHRYYRHFGKKQIGSFYGTEQYRITDRLGTQITAQVRYERYSLDQRQMGPFPGYKFAVDWMFFSPRIGFSYVVNEETSVYANLAISSRTPNDDDIYDANKPGVLPSLENVDSIGTYSGGVLYAVSGDPTAAPEQVYDFELGSNYETKRYSAAVNFFYMDFRNEILEYAGYSDGRDVTINVDGSFHSGIELSGSATLSEGLTLSGNIAYNINRIKDYLDTLDYEVDSTTASGDTTWGESAYINYRDKQQPNFPEYLGNLLVDYNRKPIRVTWYGRFIGRQYTEMWNVEDMSIAPVFVASLSASFSLENFLQFGRLTLTARVDNLFDEKYESIASWAENSAFREAGQPVEIGGWAAYFVAPERSFYGQVSLELF